MVQSVELLPDVAAEALLRAEWESLLGAGLASQARHRAPSNRPHVTMVALESLDPATEERVAGLCRDALPLTAYVGPPAVFGQDPVVLVRLVVATRELLDLQAAVGLACGVRGDDLTAPGRWLPHVTLAHRMPRDQVSDALGLLPRWEAPVRFETARRWDGEARRTWELTRPPA